MAPPITHIIMSDSNSKHNNIDRSQTGEEPGKPLAPLWIIMVINPLMNGLLRSPLHKLLDGTLMLLAYTGRKTGK